MPEEDWFTLYTKDVGHKVIDHACALALDMMVLTYLVSLLGIRMLAQLASCSIPLCNGYIYGIPDPSDCSRALEKIPYATSRGDDGITAPHLFVEPQMMPNPFGFVSNTYRPNKIIQLPKIWKYSKSLLPNFNVIRF